MKEELDLLLLQIKRCVQFIMESDKGINDKTGTNTLVDSDIYNQLEISEENGEIITLLINDYIDYIESGTPPGVWVSSDVIVRWAARKGIPTDNDTIWKILNSIYVYGISARPIMDEALNKIDESIFDYFDSMFETLTADLDDFFNN